MILSLLNEPSRFLRAQIGEQAKNGFSPGSYFLKGFALPL
jgi:hypothetical protein